jgi:cAMP-dependent protein kinase regulator
MTESRPTRPSQSDPAGATKSDLPVDHALSLLIADETEAALRWGAASLESGDASASALIVTCRLLDHMGRRRAAIDGLGLAVRQAVDEGDLPAAMTAVAELRALGMDVTAHLERIANAFCRDAARLLQEEARPLLPQLGDFQPLSPFLAGPALASKAVKILERVIRTQDDVVGQEPQRIAPVPLFSSLTREALQALLGAFETLSVAVGESVIREGETGGAVYLVARGELEVSRRSSGADGKPSVTLARLGNGAFFGEMALLSQLPGAATVIATRPSVLLAARRDKIEEVAQIFPELAAQLAAHCRRLSVANLGWASPVIVAVPPGERASLVDRFETRIFETGDRLVETGEEADGLHLIVSGEVAIVAHDGTERVALANLSPGETVGEVELVLCRRANADAIATACTATLFLSRDEFFALVEDHPTVLHALYAIAVRRLSETKFALEAGSAPVAEESLIDEPSLALRAPAVERSFQSTPPASRIPPIPDAPPAPALPKSSPPPAALPRVTLPVYAGARRRRITVPPPPAAGLPRQAQSIPVGQQVDHQPFDLAAPIAAPAAERAASFAPTTASMAPPATPSHSQFWERSRSAGRMTLVAAAAGVIAYAALHTDQARMPSAPVTTAAAGVTAVDSIPGAPVAAPVQTPSTVPTLPSASAQAAPIAKSKWTPALASSPARLPSAALAAVAPPAIIPASSPSTGHAAPGAQATATATGSPQPAAAPSARPFVPNSTKAASSEALSAGDFGGRE